MGTNGRKHVSLSKKAFSVIESDMLEFDDSANISGFINQILQNYAEDSSAAISKRLFEYRTALIGTLGSDCGEVIEKLVNKKEEELISQALSYPKDIEYKLFMRVATNKLLFEDNGLFFQNMDYYTTQAGYLKAIIEDYADKSFIQREAIYYKDTIDSLTNYIEVDSDHPLLNIRYKTNRGEEHEFIIKPYKLIEDYEHGYNFLIALSSAKNQDYRPAVFRVSRILSVKPCKKYLGSGRIRKAEAKALEEELQEKGTSFLVGESKAIKLFLSPAGWEMYLNQHHLRPKYEKCEDAPKNYKRLLFHCTERQIKYYFFKFGKEVKILQPAELAEEFANDYSKAAGVYKKASAVS